MSDFDYVELDGDRLTDDERATIRNRECVRLTGFGLPWMQRCQRDLSTEQVARGQVECDEHEADAREYSKPIRLTDEDARRVFHRLP